MIPSVALWALLLGGPAEPALASGEVDPVAVNLAVDSCAALPREQLARLLVLELKTAVLTPEQPGERAVRVQVACTGSTVRIAVKDPTQAGPLERVATFSPEHEGVMLRLVALAIAELVLTSRVAPFEKGQAPAAIVAPAPQPPAVPEGARPSGHGYVLALGQALGPFSGVGIGWGLGLRLGWAFGQGWSKRPAMGAGAVVDIELTAAGTSAERSLGTVQIALWSATLRASLRLRARWAWFDLGGGGRLGLAQLQGAPIDAATARGSGATGVWAGPVVYAGMGGRFGHVVVALGIEGGRVLRTVSGTVDDGPPISIDGSWACGTVAAGWGD